MTRVALETMARSSQQCRTNLLRSDQMLQCKPASRIRVIAQLVTAFSLEIPLNLWKFLVISLGTLCLGGQLIAREAQAGASWIDLE